MSNQNDVIHADRRLQWFAIGLILVAAVVGAGILVWLQSYLQFQLQLLQSDPQRAAENILAVTRMMLIAFGLSLVAFSVYFGWLGMRVLRSGQFPPPGMKVVRDTRLRLGSAARLTGAAALVYCLLLLGIGTLGAWRIERGVYQIIQSAASTQLPQPENAGPALVDDDELPT